MSEFKFQSSIAELQAKLVATGIPFDGITPRPTKQGEPAYFTDGGTGFFVQIHFAPGTTEQQQQQLADILTTHSFTRRRAKARQEIRQALKALTAAQRTDVFTEIAVNYILEDPGFARRIGLNLDGDEEQPANAGLKGGR